MAEHSDNERPDGATVDELDPAVAGDEQSPKRETISDGLFADLVDTIAATGYVWPIVGPMISAERPTVTEPTELSARIMRSAPAEPAEVELPFVSLPVELVDEIVELLRGAERALGIIPDGGKLWPKHNERPGMIVRRIVNERRDRAVYGIVERALEELVELQEVRGLPMHAMHEIRRGLRSSTDAALGKLGSDRPRAHLEATYGHGSPAPTIVLDHREPELRTVPARPIEELRLPADRRTDPLGLLVGDELADRVEWLVGEAVAYQELADECYLIRATVERSIARAERQIGTLERETREQPSPHQIREALSAPRPDERVEALRALGSSKSEAVRVLVADAIGTISPDLFRMPGSPEAVQRIRRALLSALDEELAALVAESRGAKR